MKKTAIILSLLLVLSYSGWTKTTHHTGGDKDSTQTAPVSKKLSNFSVGLNGWMIYNAPSAAEKDYFDNAKGYTSLFGGIKASWNIRSFEIGVGLHYGKTGGEYDSRYPFRNVASPFSFSYRWRGRFLTPYVYQNYKFTNRRSYFYAGVNAGYVIFLDQDIIQYQNYTDGVRPWQYHLKGNDQKKAVRLGLQGGYNLNFARHWSVQAETGLYYIPLTTTYMDVNISADKWEYDVTTSFLQVPITIGMVYRF